MALWDLAGKAAGKPFTNCYGGKDAGACRDEMVGLGPPTRRQRPSPDGHGTWLSAMKVRSVSAATPILSELRPSAPSSARMQAGVDANGGWGDPSIAIAAIERLKPLGIAFVEQPVWAGDPARCRKSAA